MNSGKFLNQKLIWGLFFVSVLIAVISNLSGAGLNTDKNGPVLSAAFVLPFLAVYAHAFYALGGKRSLFFLGLSFLTGLLFEVIGVNFGTALGQAYSYAMPGPSLAGVPLVVPLFWFVFIYTVYGSTNAAVRIKGAKLPTAPATQIKFLVFLILLDAVLLTMIDLIMDPVMVGWGRWSWPGGGSYFNIPVENFLGWFLISLLVTGAYRIFEYYHPASERENEGGIIYIPVLGLTVIYASFILYAFMMPLRSLGFMSIFLYLPLAFFLLNMAGNLLKPPGPSAISREKI